MKRRQIIKLFTLSAVLPIYRIGNATVDKKNGALEFFAAGVRFQDPVSTPLSTGDNVNIRGEDFDGSLAYAIYSDQNQRIGFVPDDLVSTLPVNNTYNGTMLKVSTYAVPWKRYRIRISY